MSRLQECLVSGVAPGFNQKTIDPGSPQSAIKRALRTLEIDMGSHSDRIKRATQYSTKRLREVWFDGKKKRKHQPKEQ